MTPGELGVAAFFIAVALFGIVDAIRTPLVVKRLYRNKGLNWLESRLSMPVAIQVAMQHPNPGLPSAKPGQPVAGILR